MKLNRVRPAGHKAKQHRPKAKGHKTTRRPVTAKHKVKRMASRAKTITIPVVSGLLALGMADAAGNGAVQNLVRGQIKAAGQNLASSIADPKTALTRAIPFAFGLAGVAMAKRAGLAPSKKIGPVRIAI